MSDGKKQSAASQEADEAIRAALESVERLEREAEDDLDPDAIEVLRPSDAPPSADPDAHSDAEPLRAHAAEEGDEEEILVEDERAPPRKSGGQDMLLQSYIDARNEAVKVLEQTQKEAKSLRERLLRVSAEFENYKKRQGREKQDAIKFANEGVLKELLPVLDNFERAIAGSRGASEGDPQKTLDTVVQGVEMVFKQLSDSLKRFGVEGFSAVGERFDPARHEAVATREDVSVPNQTVLEEYQRGYMLHGRLVRPAMVIVSSGGPPAAPAGGAGGGDVNADPPDEGGGES